MTLSDALRWLYHIDKNMKLSNGTVIREIADILDHVHLGIRQSVVIMEVGGTHAILPRQDGYVGNKALFWEVREDEIATPFVLEGVNMVIDLE